MSRRRGEFEHRTSIFEGAYRAWSHLGGCDPTSIIYGTCSAADLDPLLYPHVKDSRSSSGKADEKRSGSRRFYPYEPLPRSGLAHPFVQAVITPWLGPDGSKNDNHMALTTLRTWWQHRRKGESVSSKAALGTPEMNGVVDGYTRHFFNLAHCIVVDDNEQPPRTLCAKLKIAQRNNVQVGKKAREKAALENAYNAMNKTETTVSRTRTAESLTGGASSRSMIAPPIPLAHHHHHQQQQQHALQHASQYSSQHSSQQHEHAQTQRLHHGDVNAYVNEQPHPPQPINDRPNTTPIVLKSDRGEIQIAMKINGIVSSHCVRMIETVLKGINNSDSVSDSDVGSERSSGRAIDMSTSQSSILGLLDIVIDKDLSAAVVKISQVVSAQRIVNEMKELLNLIGYDIEVKVIDIDDVLAMMQSKYTHNVYDSKQIAEMIITAFETLVQQRSSVPTIDWRTMCTCPDNKVLKRGKCQQ